MKQVYYHTRLASSVAPSAAPHTRTEVKGTGTIVDWEETLTMNPVTAE